MIEFAQTAGAQVDRDAEVLPDPMAIEPSDDMGSEPMLVEADLLVEDVSIDGMCGVY